MNKKLRIIGISVATLLISPVSIAEIIHEDDGFVWEKLPNGGAKVNGKVVINPANGQNIYYSTATDGPASLGYFDVVCFTGKKFRYGIADVHGNFLLPMKYDGARMTMKIRDRDTLIYLSSAKDDYKKQTIKYTYYDLSGRKLNIPADGNVTVDDEGYFYSKSTGNKFQKIPIANGKLGRFHQRAISEIINTELGDYLVSERINEDFKWKFIVSKDSKLCAAMDMDNNMIIPVTERIHDLKYEKGLFIGRQDTPEGKACAYNRNGDVIVPIAAGHNHLHITSTGTHSFLSASDNKYNANNGESTGLYDLAGNTLIPNSIYSFINVSNNNDIPYFICTKINDKTQDVLDANLNILLSVDKKYEIWDMKIDNFGTYYIFSFADDDRHLQGIMSESGSIIIYPKYDLVKRIVRGNNAYYETCIVYKNKKGEKDYMHGVCDLSGKELVPCEYDYISENFTGKLYFKKGELTYKIDIDVSKPVKQEVIQREGLYYLVNSSGDPINPIGYQKLVYNEERFCYTATIDKYTTTLTPTGKETNPILNQIFNEAYELIDSKNDMALNLFFRILELDNQHKFTGIKSQACNNIGYIFQKQGNNEKAIEYYSLAVKYAPTNLIAENNLNSLLYPTPKEELEKENSTLGIITNVLGFNNALVSYNSSVNHRNNNTDRYTSEDRPRKKVKSDQFVVAKAVNENQARNNYWGYAAILDEMKYGHQPYNDSERRRIQSKMTSIRKQYGFRMASQETWDGTPN